MDRCTKTSVHLFRYSYDLISKRIFRTKAERWDLGPRQWHSESPVIAGRSLFTVRVLVIGSGAREHALLLSLARDPGVTALICAPGNAGIAKIAEQHPIDVASGDAVTALAQKVEADLVVIGPEVPLVLGVADAVRAAGIACFGPSADAARIEGSKLSPRT